MIDLLRTLCTSLCEPDITVLRCAALIGDVLPRAGTMSPWEIAPYSPLLAQAEIVGDREDAAPNYVRLTVSETARLTVSDLSAVFGEAIPVPRSRPGQGDRWAYYPDSLGKSAQCAVIAETSNTGSETVHLLTLRRDPV